MIDAVTPPDKLRTFRFAPSPNGYLHLGHAYSALLNFDLAQECGGIFLLRIEDIDTARCRPQFEAAIYEDLAWLGLVWPEPVMRQSTRSSAYRAALAELEAKNLLYPCFCTRTELARGSHVTDPNGAPLYPGTCRHLTASQLEIHRKQNRPFALRLDMAKALRQTPPLFWHEADAVAPVPAQPELWGDVVLARKDIGTSYHLSVVVDDAAQNISDVVRGADLLTSTHIHRLLQHLVNLPVPDYLHHKLLLDSEGGKLAKSQLSKPLRQWRAEGFSPSDIRTLIGLAKP